MNGAGDCFLALRRMVFRCYMYLFLKCKLLINIGLLALLIMRSQRLDAEEIVSVELNGSVKKCAFYRGKVTRSL